MQCNRCRSDPVLFQNYSGKNLCRDHFIADFEARAKRVIRQHQWMRPGDHIAVPSFGDCDSSALLFFLQEVAGRRRDVQISAIPAHRELIAASGTFPYEEAAAGIGATRIALATSLDEIAISVLCAVIRGLPDPARAPGKLSHNKGVMIPRIYPFSGIPLEEIGLYARLQVMGSDSSCPEDSFVMFRNEVKTILDEYTSRHPATKYAVAGLSRQLAGCNLNMGEEIL